ncbi:hypothetical protein SEA_EESA_54 [Arthrobacter phage Eesa]|nr:hypothetical protein SEA_EESA_54 [Arthrobacter phage Eesa]
MKKAEHALRTGQPRLAELYMRRGLSESPEGRAWLARRDTLAALAAVGVELQDWMGRCLEALGIAFEPVRAAAVGLQTDFALAGPVRG